MEEKIIKKIYSNNLVITANSQYAHRCDREVSYDCMIQKENGYIEDVSTNCSRWATDSYIKKIGNTSEGIICEYGEEFFPEFNPCKEEQPESKERVVQFLWVKSPINAYLEIYRGKIYATDIEPVAKKVEIKEEYQPIIEDEL